MSEMSQGILIGGIAATVGRLVWGGIARWWQGQKEQGE